MCVEFDSKECGSPFKYNEKIPANSMEKPWVILEKLRNIVGPEKWSP